MIAPAPFPIFACLHREPCSFELARRILRAAPGGTDWVWNRAVFAAYQTANMEKSIHSAVANDDEQMIIRVAQGDRAAFLTLYDRFSGPLYSLALKMLANEAEAEDLLQEVFLSVWNKAATFRSDRGSAFSWVVAQLRNRAIDRIRSKRRRGELLEANAPELEPTGSVTTSSAENCEISERAREVRSAMGQLTDDQRQVLRMAYFEGMTQVEIAEKLEEPLGTIKARAQRGMARLRTILRGIHE
jgi:RNA polymerase sigma-70 factor (ECF subfamily)